MPRKNKKTEKKTKNTKYRHKFWFALLRPIAYLIVKIKFGYRYKKAQNLPDNYIVLSNHTTDFDPIFVALSFRKQMYFVASEHITRWKTAYKLINYIFEPIVRYKGTIASSTVREILRKTKSGQNVCMFAEGVRSWNGETGEILPSTAKLIKSAGCGLVTYRLSGGYFVSPNWSEGKTRKGRVSGKPIKVYTKEDIAKMSDQELYDIIKTDLYENAYDEQMINMYKYKGKNLAEKLENLIFICPKCSKYETLKSHKDTITCSECGKEFKYNKYGMLENIEYKTILELSKFQDKQISNDVKNNVTYNTPSIILSRININHTKEKLYEGNMCMNCNELVCGDFKFKTNDIVDLAIYGKKGIVFSLNNEFYEIVIAKEFNAYKYVLYYKESVRNNKKG